MDRSPITVPITIGNRLPDFIWPLRDINNELQLGAQGILPFHVHVRKAGGFAKYWIEPVELDFSQGMKVNDLKIVEQLIIEHLELIKTKWNEVYGF